MASSFPPIGIQIPSVVTEFLASPSVRTAEHIVALSAVGYVVVKCYGLGAGKTLGMVTRLLLNSVPGANAAIDATLDSEVAKTAPELLKKCLPAYPITVPEKGLTAEQVLKELKEIQAHDIDPSKGLTFAYVYTPFESGVKKMAEQAGAMFQHLNAVNPSAFSSLRKMELETVSMCKSMTGNIDGVCGSLTSGGTESLLMAVKTAREWGLDQGITEPECVLPATAHPAFGKAGHTLHVKMVYVPVDPVTQVANAKAMAAAVNKNTCLIVGSAPQYPHSVMDPIEDIAKIAVKRGILMHVDACYGGFVLPWIERAGYPVPLWDFRVEGVTSMSMDIHKYGYSLKGASCILYRSRELRVKQYWATSEWPGGFFVSPSMLGTRGGGPIAAAWATMKYFGEDGFKKSCVGLMNASKYLQDEVRATKGVYVIGNPVMAGFAIGSDDPSLNIYAMADVMEEQGGWVLERNTYPPSLHLSIMPPHAESKEKFITDMRAAIKTIKAHPEKNKSGSAAMYGMVATIPDGCVADSLLTKILDVMYTCEN